MGEREIYRRSGKRRRGSGVEREKESEFEREGNTAKCEGRETEREEYTAGTRERERYRTTHRRREKVRT